MIDELTSLYKITTVIIDTGDISIKKLYKPEDPTTNPSLILNTAQISEYQPLIDEAITWAQEQNQSYKEQIIDACDKLAVNIGLAILQLIPGRISTEVDARLSCNT